MPNINKNCNCNTGEIIGAKGGCGICSPVYLPNNYQEEITQQADKIVQHFFNLGARCGADDLRFVRDIIYQSLDQTREETIKECIDSIHQIEVMKGFNAIREEIKLFLKSLINLKSKV